MDGGVKGGKGGGGAHSAESPANRRFRPVHVSLPVTLNVASMYPSSGAKKNCTPLAAWSSVSDVGSVGWSSLVPAAILVNVFVAAL
jgi:hypothetical protein